MLSAAALRSENSPARLVRAGVFASSAVAGVLFRLWIVASPLGVLDGDEAVVGLMARRALDGSFNAFYWGQEYGGSQEALLVAALLFVGVPARWAMELVPIGLHLGAAVLVWRIGVHLSRFARDSGSSGPPSARETRWPLLAAGICWAASPALLWWSTKERGFYGFTLVCGLTVLLLTLRSCCPSGDQKGHEGGVGTARRATSTSVGLGLAAGLGWWASPQILHFVVPSGLWLVWTHRRRLAALAKTVAVAAPAAVVGALPWLWANAETGLASFEAAGDRRLFGDPFDVFFRFGVPMVLGLREPITLGWELPGARVAYAAVLLGLAALLVVRPTPLRPVLLAVAAYPLVFAVLPTTYYYGEPRYLDFLWPLLAIVAGWAITRIPWVVAQAAVVAAVLAVTANGVAGMVELQGPPGAPFEDLSPEPVTELVRTLDAVGADRVFADYWVAYRLTFETDERIVATPLQVVRDRRIDQAVRKSEAPVYVVVAGTCGRPLRERLSAVGVGYDVTPVAGVWDVVVPDRRVLPEELGPPFC